MPKDRQRALELVVRLVGKLSEVFSCALLQKAQWEVEWHWRYTVRKEPYDDEAKEYLTQKALKMSEMRWEALDDLQREELLAKDLWIEENCEVRPAVAAHPMRNSLQ